LTYSTLGPIVVAVIRRTATTNDQAAYARMRVQTLLRQPDEWLPRIRFGAGRRWYERIVREPDHEIWLLSWLPDDGTGFHDHAGSAGAFAVALGSLEEREIRDGVTIRRPRNSGEISSFHPGYIHEVINVSEAPAVSLHAYAPPLTAMNRYELREHGPAFATRENASDW